MGCGHRPLPEGARGRGRAHIVAVAVRRGRSLAPGSPPARPALSVPPGSGFPVGADAFAAPSLLLLLLRSSLRAALQPSGGACPAQPNPARPGPAPPAALPARPGPAEGDSGHPPAGAPAGPWGCPAPREWRGASSTLSSALAGCCLPPGPSWGSSSSSSAPLTSSGSGDIRETAFVYAITAAGVSHAITQACSMGELLQCGCELTRSRAPPSPTAGPGTEGTAWEWGGCGDDVQFGYEKSQQFMDAKNKKGKNDIRALIDLHNNEAGRLAVRSYMRTECKCHGLSGSCTLRTCWRKMPHFREVGDRLLERFNGAFKVMGGNDGKTLIPVGDNIKPPDKQDLIYSADSPDFCSANRKTGSLGTRGRVCNSTAMDTSGCDLLCCGRGHRDETVVLEENCLCRFHWCCVVQCRKCSVRQELSLCI
ncbi:protein Wnt-6 isoform X2 [Aphelocoma coerulescens]|uniref:protein Wnt-6 isoform X2 n=1 Tax=Aphelocoma coerulescens TaxID=39617 RepID=UPI003604DE4A